MEKAIKNSELAWEEYYKYEAKMNEITDGQFMPTPTKYLDSEILINKNETSQSGRY